MEMHEIQYFLAVCDTLNFNRAAEHCHITQPALTRAIQKLEDELGQLMRQQLSEVLHRTQAGRPPRSVSSIARRR